MQRELKRRLQETLPTAVRGAAKAGRGPAEAGPGPRARVVAYCQKIALGALGLVTMGCTESGMVEPTPPSHCTNELPTLTGQAKYTTSGTDPVIELKLSPPALGSNITQQTILDVTDGTKQSEQVNGELKVLTAHLLAASPERPVRVHIQALCEGVTGDFYVTLTPKATPQAGDSVPVSITET